MQKFEAVALLAECVPLANRLMAQGVDTELTAADRAALEGLNRMLDTDWLIDPAVLRQAGLNLISVGMLVALVIQMEAAD